MASIEKRTRNGQTTYRVRYRDPSGRQRSVTESTPTAAKRTANRIEADMDRGTYLDQSLGKITLTDYAETWLAIQTFEETTRESTEGRLRNHVLPTLGSTRLSALRPTQIQAWLRQLHKTLAPQTVATVLSTLSAVLEAAVDDERIGKNPCRAGSISKPKVVRRKVVPWTDEQAAGIVAALPERYGLLAVLATGLGLRQGEVFGLALNDIDFLRGTVHVQRQVRQVRGRLYFAPPKNGKDRTVPLPSSVATAINLHLATFAATNVTLPWKSEGGEPTTARVLLSSREAGALNRHYINSFVWKPAIVSAGLVADRTNGMHAGRHYYASIQLEEGTSIRALADYLGHTDPGFTLRIYTHLMPAAEDKARRAVDEAFERINRLAATG